MKSYIKKLFVLFFIAISFYSLTSCNFISQDNGIRNDQNTEQISNINTLYNQAKNLGYNGSLEEFRENIKGKDGKDGKDGQDGANGIIITNSIVNESGHLIFILSNGNTIDAGELSSSSSNNGTFKVTFFLKKAESYETYSSNYKVELPNELKNKDYSYNNWYYIDPFSKNLQLWNFSAYAITKDITLYYNDLESEFPWDAPAGLDRWWEDITYDETDLIFMMTNCSNNQELISGCDKYLSGEYKDGTNDSIDKLVSERNRNAYDYTNVNITYKYYDDIASLYGYTKISDIIVNEIMSTDKNTPDIYCNWSTDILICSLKGCFANLYSRHYGSSETKANNHFRIAEEGYLTEYMESLTLSDKKMYIIASDYFIDILRSMYVIPVNITLFNEIAADMYPNVVDPDITDLLEEVKPCNCTNETKANSCNDDCPYSNWTYDRLMQFSQSIYKASGTSDTEIIDDVLGFALGNNGLPARALIYSSSVNMIKKEWNENTGKYDYYYPSENTDLENLFNKIYEMMNVDGIMYVTHADANSLNYEGDRTPLLGIRNQFTNNKILFGGIVLLGSLEYTNYQNMNTYENCGFCVVPLPTYQLGDPYNTQLHVTSRVGAIRVNTSKFVQCSAFLQYQTENSSKILNEYYHEYFDSKNTYSEIYKKGNIDMVKYIYKNVRNGTDAYFEDAIGFMFENISVDYSKRIHILLCTNGYQMQNIKNKYLEFKEIYNDKLESLENEYAKLPS